MLDKFERKFGKFAIPHLMNYIIFGYVLGYILMFGSSLTGVDFLSYLTFDPYQIIHPTAFRIPQFWRIFTWIIIPPFGRGFLNFILAIIMMVFYWQLGNILENTWGTFRFNCYIFGGMLSTLVSGLLLYGLFSIGSDPVTMISIRLLLSKIMTTNYVCMSIFLAFSLGFPDMTVFLYFIVPIKMKWLAVLYIIFSLYDIVRYARYGSSMGVGWQFTLVSAVVIFASLLNFIIYYLSTKGYQRVTPRYSGGRSYRRSFFHRNGSPGREEKVVHHRCCICGRTDVSNPELTFRYCSKCKGNKEYCQDHLFNHTHVV